MEKNFFGEYLCSAEELSLYKTFECGQCFRWNADSDGVYTGVASGIVAKLAEKDGSVYIRSSKGDIAFWRHYFDLDSDYEAGMELMRRHEYLELCAVFGKGIRILRQDSWEALCSFIISQCNNIPRIKGIVERLCRSFGDKIIFEGEEYYSFPSYERIALMDAADLSPLRAGYRAAYIIAAARAVTTGEVDLDMASQLSAEEAKKHLKQIDGVGDKVADCAILYGLHITEAFPVDVWMKRALKEYFPPEFDPKTLGEFAGLAQQYIFFMTRSTGSGK